VAYSKILVDKYQVITYNNTLIINIAKCKTLCYTVL